MQVPAERERERGRDWVSDNNRQVSGVSDSPATRNISRQLVRRARLATRVASYFINDTILLERAVAAV